MANNKKIFFCQNCGFESPKWLGQCPACHEWNSFVEELKSKTSTSSTKYSVSKSEILSIKNIIITDDHRISSHISELDRVLGGGIVQGSLVLIGGEPGIGKSTLLMQACINLSKNTNLLYVSGEESASQIKSRADRIGETSEKFLLFCDGNLENILEAIHKTSPKIVVIDSIQTIVSGDISSAAGSVSQVREVTARILRVAKEQNITFFIIGHVTKEGMVAGPRVLEHMVDTVLYFEGDNNNLYRILRSVKNRFGAANEIGVFEMSGKGLIEVNNPSGFMINDSSENSGTVITSVIEGSRTLLVEIQALISESVFQIPRRTSYGIDYNRVNLLLAVLEKRARLKLIGCDAYVNVAGGFKLNEPAVDLAIVSAIISSYANIPVNSKTVVLGEVGLSGEIRAVNRVANRVNEALNLGFDTVILPYANAKDVKEYKNIKFVYVKNVEDILRVIK